MPKVATNVPYSEFCGLVHWKAYPRKTYPELSERTGYSRSHIARAFTTPARMSRKLADAIYRVYPSSKQVVELYACQVVKASNAPCRL
jgi:hypothetical protein